MKTIDQLKGPRPHKRKPKRAKSTARKPKHSYSYHDSGAPLLPADRADDAYELASLLDTFNL